MVQRWWNELLSSLHLTKQTFLLTTVFFKCLLPDWYLNVNVKLELESIHSAVCVVSSPEHREQAEDRSSRRPRLVSDGRCCPLPSGQSHSPALCRQHPRPITCSGTSQTVRPLMWSKGHEIWSSSVFYLWFRLYSDTVTDTINDRVCTVNSVCSKRIFCLYFRKLSFLCKWVFVWLFASSPNLAWPSVGEMWRTSWTPAERLVYQR